MLNFPRTEGVNVRFSGVLKEFVEERSGSRGLYGSVSEYIRVLVRRDYEREEARRWDSLADTLKAGIEDPEAAFAALKAEDILLEVRKSPLSEG